MKFMLLVNIPVIPLLVLNAFGADLSVILGILTGMFILGKFLEVKVFRK